MLVIFLVGIIAALAMPNLVVQDDFEVLQQSAREMLVAMQLQQEEAVLTGTQHGLRLEPGEANADGGVAFQWLVWSADKGLWTVAEDQLRQFDSVIDGAAEFTLLIDGQPIAKQEEASKAGEDTQRVPQIVMYSSGDVTDFELVLRGADATNFVTLRGSYEGLVLDVDRQDETGD